MYGLEQPPLPIVSFAGRDNGICKEDKMVVRIIHFDENGNPLEEGQTRQRQKKQRVLKRRQIKKKQMLMRQTPMRRKRLSQKPTRAELEGQLSKLRMISVPKLLHMRSSSWKPLQIRRNKPEYWC